MLTQYEIVDQGKQYYYKIKSKLEKIYPPSEYIAIEVESEKYFTGQTPVEAINKVLRKFPKYQFFLAQVGQISGLLK